MNVGACINYLLNSRPKMNPFESFDMKFIITIITIIVSRDGVFGPESCGSSRGDDPKQAVFFYEHNL